MPGPKSGVHGLKCVDREGTACTKVGAAVPSAYLALVAYAVILRGRLGVLDVDAFAVLCPLLFGWWTFSPLVGFLHVRPAGRCCRCSLWSSRPCWCSSPGFLAGSAAARGGLRCWSRPSPRPSFLVFCLRGRDFGIFADFDVVTYFDRFCGIFRVAGCPPGGEICGM